MLENFWEVRILKELSGDLSDEWKKLRTDYREYSNGEIVLFSGDSINKVGFVLDGVLKTVKYTRSGKEISNHYFSEGDIVPHYTEWNKADTYNFNLVCEKAAVIRWMPLDTFKDLINSDINIMESLLKYICEQGLESERLLEALRYKKVDERLAFYFLHSNFEEKDGWLEVPFPQRILADKLNMTRSVLNQELGNFEEKGLIKREKGAIKVLRPDKLEDFL